MAAEYTLCDDAPQTAWNSATGPCMDVGTVCDTSSRGSRSHSPVASDAEVEASQPVTAQRVGAALQEEHSYSPDLYFENIPTFILKYTRQG